MAAEINKPSLRSCLLVLLMFCPIRSSEAATSDNEATSYNSESPYPPGDFRRCLHLPNMNKVRRFAVLPGFGWDNLRNLDQGQIVNLNYSLCRMTEDGRFLLPDTAWESSDSQTINLDLGVQGPTLNIGGKFAREFQEIKRTQINEQSQTTRAQIRYVRYAVHLQPDTPLHPIFRKRTLNIAAAVEMNATEQARYLSQLLVRDFGTHVVTRSLAGAALVKTDHLQKSWMESQTKSNQRNKISASAAFLLWNSFNVSSGFSFETSSDKSFTNSYSQHLTRSHVHALGGPLFRLAGFGPDDWAAQVEGELVAVDRSGDPLHYLVTAAYFPELPFNTLNSVSRLVQEAVTCYYSYNVHRGCMKQDSKNFSPSANVDDGSCDPPSTKLNFGGMFQTCTVGSSSYDKNVCYDMTQVNPMTGNYSCASNYDPIFLAEGVNRSTSVVEKCRSCGFLWLSECCDNVRYESKGFYKMFWCAASRPLPEQSGYLFGGVFTSSVANPLTNDQTCPATFYPLHVGARADLHVCISNNYELGTRYSVPFAGFMSCKNGNPLVLLASNSSFQSNVRDNGMDMPQRCPPGFSKHLATVDQGCEINYCVRTGSLAESVLPPIRRPPFMPTPRIPAPPSGSTVFDPVSQTWSKAAVEASGGRASPLMSALNSPSGTGTDGFPPSLITVFTCVALALLCVSERE